jgi:predicted acylesterase/phospholipase RssA
MAFSSIRKIITLTITLLFMNSVQLKGADGKCRALALRGGGTKGAYEVGVLKGLVETLDPIET